ncbi:MAG: hypothetical protein V4657_11455 [Pseudomonadota bacterium]
MALWTPADLSVPPTLWLEGNLLTGSNGDPISSWNDSSAANNDATASGSVRPTLVTGGLNSLNVSRFVAATLQYMELPTSLLTGDTAGSGFSVAKLNNDPPGTDPKTGPIFGDFGSDTQANHYPYSDGTVYDDFLSTARKTTGNPSPSLSAWHIGEFQSGSSDWRAYFNGTLHYSTGTNTVGLGSAPVIGRSTGGGSFYFDGDLAEVIYCDTFLSQADREKIEGYLAHKWAITSVLDAGHPYKSTAPTTSTGAISGVSTVAFSTAGIATGRGALAGASTVAFSTSGTSAGKGALSGASTVAFSTTAIPRGTGSLSGASSPAFTTQGALLGSGGLSGATTVSFTTSGTVTQPNGAASGASSVAFSTAGILRGTGALSGSVTVTFSGTAIPSGGALWTPSTPANGTWANQSPATGIWTTSTPASGIWTQG